jgi:hypothetical protein
MVNEPTRLVPRAWLRRHSPRILWVLKSIMISIVVSVLTYAVTPKHVIVYLMQRSKPAVKVRVAEDKRPCTFRRIDLETGNETCFR